MDYDKNCQEKINMRPKKSISHMQSVTNTNDRQLSKPAIIRLCSDKNYQPTRCYKKKSPVRPMYKNCQSV